ncbi:MAG: FAD-binding protein [Sedimentisphaerales bacterium]|jgi:electron transfer flavoprotein alpha subunit|nr:FAD-binding protein [Sedimentisphaerales bacterium]
MTDCIILVKQVPDVSQVTDQAFDPQTGNLVRSRLPNVINELDTHALALAHQVRRLSGGGRLIGVSMGPPSAEEVLRYCLARGVDNAVLLTDKALAGADTAATANPLAYAIRRIVAELLGGTKDFLVITGMQSVDGDTAQVPPQIAEELGLPCIAYVTDVAMVGGALRFSQIISGGTRVVQPKALPAVVTVANYPYPPFASFAASRWANKAKITTWGADDIKANLIGIAGSKTTVIRVFPPEPTKRMRVALTDVKGLARVLIDSLKARPPQTSQAGASTYRLPRRRSSLLERVFEATERDQQDYKLVAEVLASLGTADPTRAGPSTVAAIVHGSNGRLNEAAAQELLAGLMAAEPAFQGPVWVIGEYDSSALHPSTYELLGKARQLANDLEVEAWVCVAGHRLDGDWHQLIEAGADRVILVDHPILSTFEPLAYRKAIAQVIGNYWPQIVIFSATAQGRVLAPMVAYRLGCGLTADCTGLEIRDISRKGQIGLLLQTRPALGGNVMATIRTKNSRCQMATIRPGVMARLPADPNRKGRIVRFQPDISEQDIGCKTLELYRSDKKVDFDVDIIVSGGRGLQSQAQYQQIIDGLCGHIASCLRAKVQRGGSRAAVERGLVDRAYQIGQTGTSVAPKVYLALGISGAIQHMIGVSKAQTIIAINSDPHAPILKACDYYMVGPVEHVVPRLIDALSSAAKGDEHA